MSNKPYFKVITMLVICHINATLTTCHMHPFNFFLQFLIVLLKVVLGAISGDHLYAGAP